MVVIERRREGSFPDRRHQAEEQRRTFDRIMTHFYIVMNDAILFTRSASDGLIKSVTLWIIMWVEYNLQRVRCRV